MKNFSSYDRAVHSNFLIHWTGKDIDESHDRDWYDGDDHRSKTPLHVEDLYLQRLQSILTYGLWMCEEGDSLFRAGTKQIMIPSTPKCCFTELRLSESRRHAARYGRLGIGVKRPFLFTRCGRPLAYFSTDTFLNHDKFLEASETDVLDKRLLNFLKPMNSDPSRRNYDLYSESEWRILCFDELIEKRLVIDPRDSTNSKEHEYFKSLTPEGQEKLRYLIPLDGWLAMIIYPSWRIKSRAQWDDGFAIREQIKRIKTKEQDHGNRAEGLQRPRRGSWPIEVDIDACREF